MKCRNTEDILATCMNGIEFTAAICHENIIATQFHPEKSQDNGIQILTNFLKWNP
jgi:glutamine amidotransferase